jgi:hypothetical protein
MASSAINRPFKFGPQDRREFISENSEVALRAENDENGNPIYLGKSKVGEHEAADRWQIRAIAYDINEGVTEVTWPERLNGTASSDYEFSWNERASLTYR